MSPEKGAAEAIAVARAAGRELRIGAKCREPAEQEYFDEHVRPHLGEGVVYLGELNRTEKAELLGNAAGVLCPINWEEPFGLVMIEAAACGTPVVATRRGSVPEVVEDGVTGFVVDGPRDMLDAIDQLGRLDRRRIREVAEERFTTRSMVAAYLRAYRLALDEGDVAALSPGASG
jgi:glycosyltransferase involved in cell wall biosynthesis